MNWTRAIGLSALALGSAVLIGQTSGQGEKVTLEFWAHWASAVRRPTVDKMVGNWNKRNPNVQVNYTFVPFDQIIQKTLASVAAGNPPCVVVLAGAESKIRASKNQLTDLSALGVESVKAKYFDNAWAAGTYNGKQYALPFVTDTRMLFYRKDFFREAGLDPNKYPRTWAELETYADKLTKRDGNNLSRIGFHPVIGEGGLEMWVNNAGAMFFDAKGEEPQANNPTAVKVLEWFKSWSEKYGGNGPVNAFRAGFGAGAGPTDPFVNGKVAMMIRNAGPFSTELSKNAPNVEYGMVPVPTQDGKQNPMASAGSIFTVEVPRGCKNPKEALEYAKYWTTEGASIWAKEQNEMPGAKAAVASLANPNALKVAGNMKYTRIGLAPTYAPSYGNAINKAVDDVLIGGKDPKAALDEAQAALVKMVADGKK